MNTTTIVLISLLFRTMFTLIIKMTRLTSKSLEMLLITATVSFIYSLNYVYLYLRAPYDHVSDIQHKEDADFIPYGEQENATFLAQMNQGIYHDFNSNWFSQIGGLVLFSMLIMIVIPPLEYLLLYSLRWLIKAYDQSRCCCPRGLPQKTRMKTIFGYLNLYEGPHFDIEYQYTQVWIICFMCFTFGPMVPLIFILGFFGMLIEYATIRLRIAYSLKKFPSFDNKMNSALLKCLRLCPIIYCITSAWLYSN